MPGGREALKALLGGQFQRLSRQTRSATPGPLAPYPACLAAGLRRFPVHHGPVLLRADTESLLGHLPGTVLAEPTAVTGLASDQHELAAPVEPAIWSATGRRTSILGTPSAHPEVVFPPGTLFTVLAVLPAADGVPPRVLLRDTSLAQQEAGVCAFYVLVAEDGSVRSRFNPYDFVDGTATLGYRVAQHATGRGVATAAVRELCRPAAARHGLRTLRAAPAPIPRPRRC